MEFQLHIASDINLLFCEVIRGHSLFKYCIGSFGVFICCRDFAIFSSINKLGLEDSDFARIFIGTSFEWADLVAYSLGIALVIYLERVSANKKLESALANKKVYEPNNKRQCPIQYQL